MATNYCKNCGADLTPESKFCENCGKPIIYSEPKGYFPLLRQKGTPTPHDKKIDRDFVIVMAIIAALGIISSVYLYLPEIIPTLP